MEQPQKRWRYALALVAILAPVAFGCVWLARAAICDQEDGFSYRNPRPGTNYVAQVHMVDCGATSRYDTWVTVRTEGVTYESETVMQGYMAPTALGLKWESPTLLVIEYEGELRASQALSAWREVTIVYRARKQQP